MWFYNNVSVDNYLFWELIVFEKCNDDKFVDDMLLVDELKELFGCYLVGKYLVILYIKGLYYFYF